MKRPQIIIISVSAVCLLLCAAAAWFFFSSLSEAGAKLKKRDELMKNLRQIYNSNPFPNAENARQFKQDLEVLASWAAMLHGVCVSNTLNAAAKSPSQFSLDLKPELRELAAIPNASGNTSVPANFAFGFERYTADDAPMPVKENIDQLTRQLAMAKLLARHVMSADIQQLSEFKRRVFEDESPASRGGQQPRQAAGVNAVSKEHFTLRFTARQNALETILNRLAADSAFIDVTSIKAVKVNPKDILAPAPELVAQVKDPDIPLKPGERAFPAEVLRVVSGPGVAPLLEITLEVDILSFLPTQS